MGKKTPKRRPGRPKQPKPTFAELRAWCGIAALADEEHGTVTFTKAAGHLGFEASTLTRLVRSLSEKTRAILEDEDVELYKYDASARVATPTEIGMRLAERFTQPVADIDDVEQFIKSLRGGDRTLRVVASQGLLEHYLVDEIAKVQKRLRKDAPQSSAGRQPVPVKIYARGGGGAIKLLRAHKCHLAYVGELEPDSIRRKYPKVFADPSKSESAKSAPASLLECKGAPNGVNLYVPEGHRLLDNEFLKESPNGQHKRIQQALKIIRDDGLPLILPGTWSVFRQQLEAHFEAHGVSLHRSKIEEFDTGRTIIAAVASSMGKTIQQEVIVGPKPPRHVKLIRLEGFVPQWRILVAYYSDFLSLPARMLLENTTGVKVRPRSE